MLNQKDAAIIIATLEKFGGHREKTAQYLGISKRTLQYKLKRFGLNRDRRSGGPGQWSRRVAAAASIHNARILIGGPNSFLTHTAPAHSRRGSISVCKKTIRESRIEFCRSQMAESNQNS